MRIHHLSCGIERLPGVELVIHCLLLETDTGLVLVDTGFGTGDIADPKGRIGPFRHLSRPVLQPNATAIHHVERLGFQRDDVRHILITHFDHDHIGGLSDFPDATVHITAAEAFGAIHSPTRRERLRFNAPQWAHAPKIVEHAPGGESWRGFPAAHALTDIAPGVVLVPMPGHSRGHAAFAVDRGDRWILHCGDAFYHPSTLTRRGSAPVALRALESLVAFDRRQLRANHERLAELYARQEPDLMIVCSHDPEMFARARDTAPGRP